VRVPSFQSIEPLEIADLLKSSKDVELLDVREHYEWALCHLESAKLVPMSELHYWRHHLRADGGPYVIYCHHGIRSYQVCTYLAGLGLRNLINLKGGIDRWSRTVDPSVPIY
jgi:rhodanese-related sulfurtransferase